MQTFYTRVVFLSILLLILNKNGHYRHASQGYLLGDVSFYFSRYLYNKICALLYESTAIHNYMQGCI